MNHTPFNQLGNLLWRKPCEEEGRGEAQSEVAVGGKGKSTDVSLLGKSMGKTSETYLLSVVEVGLPLARLAIAVVVVVVVIIAKEEKQLYLGE